MLSDFNGKTALITGAGDGIGKMLAEKFHSVGMQVVVQDIRRQAATTAAKEIGKSAIPLAFDVSDREATADAAERLKDKGVSLNILWINAGAGVGSSILNGNPRNIDWAFAVNVLGPIWTAQSFVPLIENATGPKHVGITASSAALREPSGDFPLYATTKHGTFAVGEALRGELEKQDIGTTILNPGLLNTKIWDGAKARPERYGGVRHMDNSISEMWDKAKHPDVMWPSIAATIDQGGGYLTCDTEGGLSAAYRERTTQILDSIQPV